MALCTVSRGYGARGARAGGAGAGGGGGGVASARLTRGEAGARLPLSPRNLCTSGAAGSRGPGVHGATLAASGGGVAEDAGLGPDEPMVNVERSGHHQSTWICCAPCYWLRRSKAVHKALLTFAMLLVTSLLVTSPVLFLITTLPEGEQPRNCAPLVGFLFIVTPIDGKGNFL